ncbi:Ift74 [Symbiodinium sp. CCMP2592]|nr:Ift74 [Symbiodinium sp. CCMP2592]
MSKELYKAKRRRSSVREHMRMQQKAAGASGCSKVETLLMTLEAASNNLEIVLPFIPEQLRVNLASTEFSTLCDEKFRALDVEDRGELTSDDLIPVIVELSRAQKDSISTEQCRKFADMFDSNQDGLINIAEFTQMVQFVTVAGWLESQEGKDMIQKAELADRSFQDLIKMIEADKERLWSIIPFLPEWLVNHLTSKEFEEACHEQFDGLDADGSGSLEPVELIPIIQAICQTEEHGVAITEERCQRFTSLFDTDGNGVIKRDEFIEFAQFLTVMNFLTNTEEGQDVSKKATDVAQGADRNQVLLQMLDEDPDFLQEVLQQLPKPLYWEITSLDFQKACMDGFKAAAGEDCDAGSTVPPGMLVPVINQLIQVHPFKISEEQCNHFMSRWDRELKNSVTPAEFLLLARYCIVMGYLTYLVENQDALMADVMLGQEKMESVLQGLRQGSEMVWDVLPFLPQSLIDELSSPEFELSCDEFFTQLDKDGNGTLEPAELLPIVQDLTQAHAFVLTEEHCKKFVDLFDIDRNGIIAKHEFVNFVRYMMIMAFMETPEGQQAKQEVEVDKSSRAVDRLLHQLQRDRDAIIKVMPLLPEAVYSELVSQRFVTQFSDQFKALDKDGSGVLEPAELFDIIVSLSSSQPFAVTQQQCEAFTSIFDLHGDGVLRHDEFLDFARFLCIMSYLHSSDGEAAAAEAVKVLEDSKRIEDLLAALERDHEAVQQAFRQRVGAMTEVKVSDRPMTMQGVMGMKTGSMGPKRQIYDKTYYLVELRKRCQELVDEVARLNKEINDIQQDNNVYASLEKRYDNLVKTVRSLEGDLADHNLATDKQRTDTRPEEVHHMYTIMKSQNEQQRADVDQIFLEKRSHEEEIGRMEQEIASIARAAEDRLNELHPDQRREYEELREESKRLSSDLGEARDELDQVSGRLNAVESRLRSDPLRTRHQQLNQTRREFENQLIQLRQEVQQGSMSIPEQREILLSKVKNDNGEIVAAEKNNSELKLDNERLRAQIKEVQADAQEKKDESSDQQKYEILFTKDQEMTAFIEGFADSKAEEERKIKEKQESIERLLQNISKSLDLPTDVTPESHLRDMEDELDFKSRQLQNSETTQSRLEGELAKREGELEKIESLDVKISLELSQVEEKMKQYEKEMAERYDKIEDMKAQGALELQKLEESKRNLEERSVALRQQVNFIRLRYDSKRQQLQDDETAANLEGYETKIRQFGQTLHTLRTFILQKTSESDFRAEMASCLDVAGQLNKMLQDSALRPPPPV